MASVQRIEQREDLNRIAFEDGMAAVEVPVELLDEIDFRNDARTESPRLTRLETAIRSEGFQPVEPIVARIGRKGRWVVIDGGHRLTAARKISGETWANLFGPKVRSLYFLLFTTPQSWIDAPAAETEPSPKAS